MAELKNFVDLLFDDQAFDDQKPLRRAAGLKASTAAAGKARGLLLRGGNSQLAGGAVRETPAFPPGA